MLGLVNLQVYNSILNINRTNNKFKLYKFSDEKAGGVSYEKDRDISEITATDLQDEIIAPNFFKEYREQVTKIMKDDKYMLILSMYVDSIFQDFENFSEQKMIWLKMILHWYR